MKWIPIKDLCSSVKSIKWAQYSYEYFEYLDISSIDRINKKIIATTTTLTNEAPSRAKQPVIFEDIIVSTVRPNLNAVAYVEKEYDGSIASTGFCVLRPKKNILNQLFLYYFSRSQNFINRLNLLSTGASYPAVSDKIVKSLKIPLPPIKTQKRIVAVLDRAQALIDKRKEQIALMDQLIQSIFYDMFGDPVLNPMGWNKSEFGNHIISIIGGKSLGGEVREMNVGEYAVLKVSAVTSGFFNPSEYKVVNRSNLPEVLILPQKNDLLFSRANTVDLVGATCIVNADYDNLLLPDKLWRIKVKQSNLNNWFVKCLLSHNGFRRKLKKLATGTSGSMLNISKAKLKKLEMLIPPLNLQNTFADRVKKIESQKQTMTTALKELENNFNSLMQRAFKGEI